MLGMNLHAIVRGSITSVHPDETVTLYQSDGQAVAYGRVTPYYKEPITIAAQIQPNAENSLDHSETCPICRIQSRCLLTVVNRCP